tara:strand:+ start:4471 stop:7095 length:2625 start_codon:yes stop_codon:yes gene_type:complete
MTRAAINDVTFNEISIKPKGSTEYVNVLDNFQASSVLGGMSITEGIFNGGLSGFVILNDANVDNQETMDDLPSVSSLAKAGSMIRLTFSTMDEEGRDHYVNELQFYVYNVSVISNIAPGISKLGSSQSATYRLEFASYEGSSLNYQNFPLIENKDYVGRISEFIAELTSSEKTGLMAPTVVDEEESESSQSGIANTAQIEPEIVETYNGAWFKRKQSLYPWGKEKSAPGINKLIASSLNYAIPAVGFQTDEETGDITDRGTPEQNNPSYVFYQSLDRGQWHFLPIGGGSGLFGKNVVRGQEGVGQHRYKFTMDETVYKRIEDFKLIKSGDVLELEESGAFGSKYTLIEPNWRGIYNGISVEASEDDTSDDAYNNSIIGAKQNAYYHDFMSISTNLKSEDVVYNYSDLFIVEEEEDDDDEENETIGPLLGESLNFSATNPSYSSLVDPVYGYFDERYLNKPVPTIMDSYGSARSQPYMWQTMFDMTDLPLEYNDQTGEMGIRYIVDNYREPVRRAKLAYTVLRDLKEQWNRYRYSVCCNSSAPDNFMALLVGFTAAGATGVSAEFVPYGLSGNTGIDNFFRYSFVEVETWPDVLIPRGISASALVPGLSGSEDDDSNQTYYDYLIAKNVNPSVRDRQIFIAGNSGGDDFGITFNFGLTLENQTGQDYNINQDQEMVVVPVEGGKRGMFTAYNTNELTNNKAFTSAGVNVKGANYPAGFGLMPIGAMTAGINDNATSIPTAYMGTVVNMTSFRESSLNEIKTQQDVLGNPDADGGYTGPSGVTGTSSMRVIGLLNSILGSENLPSIFGGTTLDLSYQEVSEDEDGNEVIEYKNVERDDIEDRPDITENASPVPRVDSGEDKILFLFSAENDHDGRC